MREGKSKQNFHRAVEVKFSCRLYVKDQIPQCDTRNEIPKGEAFAEINIMIPMFARETFESLKEEGPVGRVGAVVPLDERLCLSRGLVFKGKLNENDDDP